MSISAKIDPGIKNAWFLLQTKGWIAPGVREHGWSKNRIFSCSRRVRGWAGQGEANYLTSRPIFKKFWGRNKWWVGKPVRRKTPVKMGENYKCEQFKQDGRQWEQYILARRRLDRRNRLLEYIKPTGDSSIYSIKAYQNKTFQYHFTI